jgi:hypothetical protein
MVVHAKLQVVFIDFPRKVIDDLIVAIHAVTGKAAGGSELSEVSHEDNGEARI